MSMRGFQPTNTYKTIRNVSGASAESIEHPENMLITENTKQLFNNNVVYLSNVLIGKHKTEVVIVLVIVKFKKPRNTSDLCASLRKLS